MDPSDFLCVCVWGGGGGGGGGRARPKDKMIKFLESKGSYFGYKTEKRIFQKCHFQCIFFYSGSRFDIWLSV